MISICLQQVAFFGPVVIPAPKAEAAGRWDGVLLVAGTDGFYERKRFAIVNQISPDPLGTARSALPDVEV